LRRPDEMSTGLELMPFAIAAGVGAIGRYRARRAEREVLGASPYSFETRMRDAELLTAAARILGTPADTGRNVSTIGEVAGTPISLARTEAGVFEALFSSSVPQEQAQTVLEQLDAEYTRLLQERVYEQVVGRAEQAGLTLEDEHVDGDNSIVLTLRVEQA
jgi:hypothetical protein